MDSATQAVSSSYYRRGGGPKRKKLNLKKRKQEEKSKEKLEVLLKTLKPVAFVPDKTLDFSRHDKLLKTLGLWDFVHLEFDQNIRQDLVANLVAYYSPEGRCSFVNGVRIKVSCADLARALKLPKKKKIVITEEEKEILEDDESIRFMEKILSAWVIMQRVEDMWIMPGEVFEWISHIKQKQLETIEWADLLWFMVQKELKAKTPLGDCFFASHMQLLIKSQREDLLREKSQVGDYEESKESKEATQPLKKKKREESTDLHKEDSSVKESMDVNGFQVLPSQVDFVRRIFEIHPDIALECRTKNQDLRTSHMNFLLSLIKVLFKFPQDPSKEDLSDAEAALAYLSTIGFKLDWLEKKLDQVKENKKKCARVCELEQQLLDLEQKCKDLSLLKTQLNKEKAELLEATAPDLSFSDVL